MIVLVPVSRFRVKYEVAAGYPYSQLERLVLQSVGEGLASIDDLVETFRIHPRLLIQSLVTLTHTGWIALGGSRGSQFVLTLEGRQALKQEQIPESIVVSPRQTYVILERITGAVIPESEVQYVPKKILEEKGLWGNCIRLQSEVFDRKLDESQVQHLLPRRPGERLRWVGPIDMVTRDYHYIPVDVDLERERALYLPQRYEIRLAPYVIERAKDAWSRSEERKTVLQWENLTQVVKVSTMAELPDLSHLDWPVLWSSDDLLYSVDQHTKLLYQVLETAKTSAFIASSVTQVRYLEELKPAILDALKRGVDVDILWGYAQGKESLDWMKKLAYDSKNEPGKFRFNREPAFSNAKIILWDEEEDAFRGVVGSYDWLALNTSDNQSTRDVQFSIKVSHPAILSNLSRCAAALWSGSHSESLSSVPDKWRRIATKLEEKVGDVNDSVTDDTNQATVRVILDREHFTLLRELTVSAQLRLLIASAKLDAEAEQRLLPICEYNHSQEFIYKVIYGQSDLKQEAIVPIRQAIERATGMLQCSSQIRANMIISDQLVCISSFNFLSQPFPKENLSREVGLVIEGIKPADHIANRLFGVV